MTKKAGDSRLIELIVTNAIVAIVYPAGRYGGMYERLAQRHVGPGR
jgi:hypothetical protein